MVLAYLTLCFLFVGLAIQYARLSDRLDHVESKLRFVEADIDRLGEMLVRATHPDGSPVYPPIVYTATGALLAFPSVTDPSDDDSGLVMVSEGGSRDD